VYAFLVHEPDVHRSFETLDRVAVDVVVPLMRTASILLLLALTACSSTADTTEDTDTADTGSDTGTDTGIDTADTDTGDSDTADTEDSGATEGSPYANCSEAGIDTSFGTWSATYDAAGNMLVYAYAFGANYGTVTYVWDDRGNWLESANDVYDDGTVDQLYRQAFDERGNRVLYAIYAGDTTQYAETRTYIYNDDGTQTMFLYWDDAWAALAGRYDTTFDARGNPFVVYVDVEDDGIVDFRQTYTYGYDGAGNPLLISHDSEGDGQIDSLSLYTYDSSNRPLTHQQTLPMYPDRFLQESWLYDADGNVVFYSYEASGVPAQQQTSRYDEAGREVERTYDVAPLGSVDRTLTWTYTCP
jgi:hypothetical protein